MGLGTPRATGVIIGVARRRIWSVGVQLACFVLLLVLLVLLINPCGLDTFFETAMSSLTDLFAGRYKLVDANPPLVDKEGYAWCLTLEQLEHHVCSGNVKISGYLFMPGEATDKTYACCTTIIHGVRGVKCARPCMSAAPKHSQKDSTSPNSFCGDVSASDFGHIQRHFDFHTHDKDLIKMLNQACCEAGTAPQDLTLDTIVQQIRSKLSEFKQTSLSKRLCPGALVWSKYGVGLVQQPRDDSLVSVSMCSWGGTLSISANELQWLAAPADKPRSTFGDFAQQTLAMRCAVLVLFNQLLLPALPLLNFRAADDPESLAAQVVENRDCIISRTKIELWNELLQATETYTQPPEDEYDNPPEIPEITINQTSANISVLARMDDIEERLKQSVFGQLMSKMHTSSKEFFRRAYSSVQDSQKRAFFLKLANQGVDDYGGPYRAILNSAIVDEAAGPLELFVPVEGDSTNCFKLNPTPFPSTDALSEYEFLGKLVALAQRHCIKIGMTISPDFWKWLAGDKLGMKDLKHLNSVSYTIFTKLLETPKEDYGADDDEELNEDLQDYLFGENVVHPEELVSVVRTMFGVKVAKEVQQALEEEGDLPALVTWDNRKEFVKRFSSLKLAQHKARMEAFCKGLGAGLPLEFLRVFTPSEMKRLFCGEAEIDIELLRKVTKYDRVEPDAPHIRLFWDALQGMSHAQRSQFLYFTTAEARLPDNPKLTIHRFDKGARHFSPEEFDTLHKTFADVLLASGAEADLVQHFVSRDVLSEKDLTKLCTVVQKQDEELARKWGSNFSAHYRDGYACRYCMSCVSR